MSLLSQITTKATQKPPRIILYGPGGVGKTTFAAGAPSPVVLPTEDGIGNLEVPHFPLMRRYEDVHNALIELLNEEHSFKTVIIDSLDHLEPLIWKAVCELGGKKSIEDFGYGKGYNEALPFWRQFFDLLTLLRDKGIAVICLAHHEVKAYNDPTNDPYDRYQIKLHKLASALAQEWADAVLFATYRLITDDSGSRTRGIGSGERVVYTEERPAYVAKNRWGLPHEIDLNFKAFASALASTRKTNKE